MNLVWIGFVLVLLSGNLLVAQESDLQLQSYLASRELNRLSLRLLEIQYARELDPLRRKKWSKKLSERYREILFDRDSKMDAESIIKRSESLVRENPELGSQDLPIAIAHAQYGQSESAFLDWWRMGASAGQRGRLLQSLTDLEVELKRIIEFNEVQLDKTMAWLPLGDNETRIRQLKLDKTEAQIVHASYLSGWTLYFQAIISAQMDAEKLQGSVRHFLRALQIEQTLPIEQIDSKWFDFSTNSSRRSLVGLVLVFAAMGNSESSDFCLEMAKRLSPALVSDATRFNKLAFSRQWKLAAEYARAVLQANQYKESPFWVDVVNTGRVAQSIGASVDANIAGTEMQRIGLLGLLRNFDAEAIADFLRRADVQMNSKNVEDLWGESLLAFRRSMDDGTELQVAEAKIKQALKSIPKNFAPVDVSRMKYLKASIEFQMDRIDAAVNSLQSIGAEFADKDRNFAEQLKWLYCQCLIQISRQDNRKAPLALATMNQLLTEFPSTKLRPKIEYWKIIVTNRLLSPEQAILALQGVTTTSPFYRDAQLEIIRHRFQIFQSTQTTEGRMQVWREIVRLDKEFRNQHSNDVERCLRSLCFVIEAGVEMKADVPFLEERISLAFDQARINDTVLSQFEPKLMHYRFLISRLAGRDLQALEMANWLFENSGDRRSEIAALSFMAENSRQLTINERTEIYQKLSDRLGNSEFDLKSSTNARVAAVRLVDLYIKAGRWKDAEVINQKLLTTNPDQRQFIFQAAVIAKNSGRPEQANTYWLKLARGAIVGSELWLEAKLELIMNMRETDSAKANKLLIQTRALAGEMPEIWQVKYNELEMLLNSDTDRSDNSQTE